MTIDKNRADALLYEHDDGRYAVASTAEDATFTRDDPAWHRLGPVIVYGSTTASLVEGPAPLTAQAEQHADWRGDFERQANAAGFDLSREEWGGEYCHPDSADAFRWYYTGRLDEACSGTPSSQPAAAPIDTLPNAQWTRHGSGSSEWWSFKGYKARKDAADQWALRKGGDELYRHTFLQVVMAHAEHAILATSANETGAEGTTSDSWARRFEQCMHSLVPALNYIQAHPGQFDARPDDDLLRIIGAWFPKLSAVVSSPATAAAVPADEWAALLDRAETIVVDAIRRMRAAHVHCQDLLRDAESFMEDKSRAAASATALIPAGWILVRRKPNETDIEALGDLKPFDNDVYVVDVWDLVINQAMLPCPADPAATDSEAAYSAASQPAQADELTAERIDAVIASGDYVPGQYGWLIHKSGRVEIRGVTASTPYRSTAAADVIVERRRQILKKGWTAEHDDGHACGEIAALAAYYAMPAGARDWPATDTGYGATFGQAILPDGWSAKIGDDRRRELVKAGALILAEIERLDRAVALAGGSR